MVSLVGVVVPQKANHPFPKNLYPHLGMPACHSKLLPSSHCQEEHGSTKYRFDLSYLPKKGWSVCGVAIESIDGEDRPVLMFKRATADQTTPSTEEFAVALKLAAENTRPKFEFVTIAAGHPFEG